MSKKEFDDCIIDSKPTPMVHLGEGNWIPLDQTEFLNIEEDIQGHDMVEFAFQNKNYKSKVIIKYYA
jgi:hypothetical protein